ncbi:MAG: hypothetical protein AMS24_02820 [Chlamydiae bacterium SM23_39]|nr:MAG: hypothetical protein AMS24_02820 [Chlamydiae bacterium SM23_39]
MKEFIEEKRSKNVGSKQMKLLLPSILEKITDKKKLDINKIWEEVAGEKLFSMTEVISFENKILVIRVKNSILNNILSVYEKKKLLKKIREKKSKDFIKNIIFKIG